MKFFQDNSYSCTFAVPDPINDNSIVNALVPMHQKHLTCTHDYVNNEASVSIDDRWATGDSVLFSATMCRTGLTQFCDNIRNSMHADSNNAKEDGRPYRSPIMLIPGETQLIQDVYNYIGSNDLQFPSDVLKFDVNIFFALQTTACLFKPGFRCNLASIIYLIEKDINFSNERNPNLKSKMEDFRKVIMALSSNNPFQTYALSLTETSTINWQDLGQKTVDICKNTMDNKDWITAENRPDWLWEQSNSDIKTGPNNKNTWGWDCLSMLNLINNHI